MTNPYATIRAALAAAKTTARICVLPGLTQETEVAIAALAELERAAQTPAPVAEIREAVITDEVARKVFNAWIDARWRLNEGQDAKYGHAMINVVRAELGPALGLVEIREPTPEECERIAEAMIGLFNRRGQARQFLPSETVAQVIFPAIRAVMWPKSEGL